MTTIRMLADTFDQPLQFRITPRQASDIASAQDLLESQQAKAVLGDKAYDGNDLRNRRAAMDATAVIPSKHSRKSPSRATTPSTSTATRSSDASDASSLSDASPSATIAVPFTLPAPSISLLP